uniref:Ig-like domain-containing protein n=1 Tax=Sundstroemia setigera TaxID=3005 RepID=A0A7S0FBF9_9STRA
MKLYYLLLAFFNYFDSTSSFTTTTTTSRLISRSIFSSNHNTKIFSEIKSSPKDRDEIECYVVNDVDVKVNGDSPEIVCTSEPEEYAWFNGIEPESMKKTDRMSEGKTECVEGSSPRGIPEWECKSD